MIQPARSAPIFLAIALVLEACTPPEQRAEQAREAIAEAIEQGDREAALEAIEDFRDAADDSADTQLELAQLLARAGNAPEAGWLLEDAVRRYPERADLGFALGRISLLLGNPARAREVADGIPPEAEQHADSLVLRAQAELQLGDFEQAMATLEEAERLYPDRPETRLVRIATLLSEDKQDEARAAVEEARAGLAGDDEDTVALRRRLDLTLAQIQAQQGETEAALAAIDALLEADPADLMAWRALGQVLAKAERTEEGLARVEAALAAGEPPAMLHALAAQMHSALGNDTAAEAALRTYAASADAAAAYQPLVNFHSARGDVEATLAVLDEAIARFPDEPPLRLQRSEALLADGDVQEARAEKDGRPRGRAPPLLAGQAARPRLARAPGRAHPARAAPRRLAQCGGACGRAGCASPP